MSLQETVQTDDWSSIAVLKLFYFCLFENLFSKFRNPIIFSILIESMNRRILFFNSLLTSLYHNSLQLSSDGCDMDGYHKSKSKRVRTTFTEEQLQILQANFQIDSNPDGQDLERIASLTGLSKRVTQVWFQNSRARQKKHVHGGGKSKSKLEWIYGLKT